MQEEGRGMRTSDHRRLHQRERFVSEVCIVEYVSDYNRKAETYT
jgi:hypothetical protein